MYNTYVNTMNRYTSVRALRSWRYTSYCELNYCEPQGDFLKMAELNILNFVDIFLLNFFRLFVNLADMSFDYIVSRLYAENRDARRVKFDVG